MTVSQVADFSGTPPSPQELQAAGFIGAMRYLAPLPNPKVITPAEATADWAAGLLLGLVWESIANPLPTNPTVCGQQAAQQAAACGFPRSVPIYVAADFDAALGTWPQLAGWGDTFSRASGHPWRHRQTEAARHGHGLRGHSCGKRSRHPARCGG